MEMKGKNKNKRKVGKVILLAMSFVMTAVLTFTITLAWFYDSDWASKSITMAGSVGIQLRDGAQTLTSGSNQLHFVINGNKAYPGQGVEVQASVYNDGGVSASGETDDSRADSGKGSACYVRAHFAVYTDIGINTGYSGSSADDPDQQMNSRYLYDFLQGLIETQNGKTDATYKWVYWQNSNAVTTLDGKKYFAGLITEATSQADAGYFYLCKTDGSTLKPLTVGETSAFLWNGSFVIPWQLTNASADKHIFIGIQFQAIQTFIPQMNGGSIVASKDNQVSPDDCTYDHASVQAVFNTCYFAPMDLVDTRTNINFGNGSYAGTTTPASGTSASGSE